MANKESTVVDLEKMALELCDRVEDMHTIHDDGVRTAIRAAMSEALHRAYDAGADGLQLLREENTRLRHKLADATSLIIRLRASRTPAQEKAMFDKLMETPGGPTQ